MTNSREAFDELVPVLYDELRGLASVMLADERRGDTLGPTAMVHEAWLRLVQVRQVSWNDRGHFFAIAARAMRRVLVDHARSRDAAAGVAFDDGDGILALDEALTRLETMNERHARVVELRVFAGLTVHETAVALDTTAALVERDWELGCAWLNDSLSASPAGAGIVDRLAGLLAERAASRADAAAVAAAAAVDAATAAPARIGPWSLVSPLGQGGMGAVYLAERADGAYERRVALKLLRRDLIEPDQRRRFLAERQILARITHECVASFIDGGVTDEGRPWFVMEYVDGSVITEWCDAQRLDVSQRIALFLRVCDAVQHAHGMLVVHRDIKPSNVLVAADGTPKLLDFGIARVLSPDTAGADVVSDGSAGADHAWSAAARTRTSFRLLTPEYASPEQVRGDPVTTASDVFQLGLLLFELLAGRRPERRDDTGRWTPETTERVTGALGDAAHAAAIAALRRTTPDRLRRHLRGDIDTILRTALHAEPARRYASAAQFAEDLRRHVAGLPVHARPDTLGYRAGKFVRRNRAGVAATAVAFVGLGIVAATLSAQASRLERERNRAERVSELLVDLFRGADPLIAQGRPVLVTDVIERGEMQVRTGLRDEPEVQGELLSTLAGVHRWLGDLPRALALEREAFDLLYAVRGPRDPRVAMQKVNISGLHASLGALDSALVHATEGVATLRSTVGPRDIRLAMALSNLAYAHQLRGEYAVADSAYEIAESVYRERGNAMRPRLAIALHNRGWIAQAAGDLATAEERMRESIAIHRAIHAEGGGDAGMRSVLGSLARVLERSGNLDEAELLAEEQLELVRRIFAPPHPQIASALSARAVMRQRRGAMAEAERLFLEAMDMLAAVPGSSDSPADLQNQLALLYLETGRPADAEPLLAASAAGYSRHVGPDHPSTAIVEGNRGRALRELGRAPEADSVQSRALRILEAGWGMGDPRLMLNYLQHGLTLIALNRSDDAEQALNRALEVGANRPLTDVPVIRTHTLLGELMAASNRFDEAERHLMQAHQGVMPLGAGNPYVEYNLRLLAEFYDRWDRPEESARYRAMQASP